VPDVRVTPDVSPAHTLVTVFVCRTKSCVNRILDALGVKRPEKLGLEPDTIFVFTDVTPWLEIVSCETANMTIRKGVANVKGKAVEVDVMKERNGGPCSEVVPVVYKYRYRLEPGAVLVYRDERREGNAVSVTTMAFVNPPEGVKVRKEKDELVIEWPPPIPEIFSTG